MRNKRQTVAVIVISMFCICLSAMLAYNLHYILIHERTLCSFSPLVIIEGLKHEQKIRQFTMLFSAVAMIGILWTAYGQHQLNYKSRMIEVTPDIIIPAHEGQGQYGTAWFLDKNKYDEFFSTVAVDEQSERLSRLINQGREGD